jgi:hypothetical protein
MAVDPWKKLRVEPALLGFGGIAAQSKTAEVIGD